MACLAQLFQQNTSLTHLDVSHNHFSSECTPSLSEALKKNHTLRGLHVAGEVQNECVVK